MTMIPTPTGKIRGSLKDVTPKLRNFVGAVKVTTSSGKGGILVDMGKPVAAYLTHDGVLHRGKGSLEILEKEQLAEFEILRYDDEQFKEAKIICENRGLLLGEEKGEAGGTPSQAKEGKPRKEENLLSSMMRRFAVPKIPEKKEPAQPAPQGEPIQVPLPQVPKGEMDKPRLAEPRPLQLVEEHLPVPERKEVSPAPPESDLSGIIRRLRESGKIEEGPVPPRVRMEETVPKAAEPVATEGGRTPTPREEKAPPEPVAPEKAGAEVPGGQAAEGRVRVDLGKMMKRIKRLDITTIRKELQVGAEGGGAAPSAGAEAPPPPSAEPATPVTGPARTPAPPLESRGKSDIDDLKAFIRRLEVLEEPGESPLPEKGLLAKLGVKSPGEKARAPPGREEVQVPVLRREKTPEEGLVAEEVKAVQKPPGEPEKPRPAESDRKAKITSILRRSGLVKPPVEEQPGELITEIAAEPGVAGEKGEAPAPAEEVEIKVPRPPRKKVEITRVPKIPEKPAREPPLIDERMIQKILKQPGVIAISTFFEGFAVQSAGRADFEQVAANAEDLFRAGKKIAREIAIGPLNQIILETGKGKLVIAPYGDLNVCIFTEADANLGLIRVAIKSLQAEKS